MSFKRWFAVMSFTALGFLVAGCDEQPWVISKVDRSVAFDNAMVRAMAAGGGIATEVYGAPWPGATPEAIADSLRMPNDLPTDIRFRAVEPQSLSPRNPHKLVLIFNGELPSDPLVACDLEANEPVNEPQSTGFELFAVFCKGRTTNSGWMAHGRLSAPKQAAGDWDGFQNLSRVFFRALLTDYSGRIDK
ncbi:MAG: hypothetical protein AAF661_12025 [Pseudomonadota bacterium]